MITNAMQVLQSNPRAETQIAREILQWCGQTSFGAVHYRDMLDHFVNFQGHEYQALDDALSHLVLEGWLCQSTALNYFQLTHSGWQIVKGIPTIAQIVEQHKQKQAEIERQERNEQARRNDVHRRMTILLSSVMLVIALLSLASKQHTPVVVSSPAESPPSVNQLPVGVTFVTGLVSYPLSVNLRNSPGLAGAVLCQVKKDDGLSIAYDSIATSNNNQWVYVHVTSVSAYTHSFMSEHNQCLVGTQGWIARSVGENAQSTLAIINP